MGPKRIIDYPTLNTLAGDDFITVWDSSEGKQKKISGTGLVFIPTKTVDANGWTVYDFGPFKKYCLSIPVNVAISAFSHYDVVVAPPAGKTLAQLRFISQWYGSYQGDQSTGTGPASGNLVASVGSVDSSSSLLFTGNIEIEATER